MCLALECLTVFLLSLFHWREKKTLKETKMGPYMPHESFLSQREKRKAKDCIRSFVFILGGCWACVCVRARVCVYFMVSVR